MESPPRRPPASVRRLWSQPNSARGPPAGSRVPNTPPSNVPSLYDLDSSLPLTARGSLRAAVAPVDHVTIYPNGDDNTRECVLSPQLQSADPLAVPVATLQQQTRAGDEVRCALGDAAVEAERADHDHPPAELSQHTKVRSYVYPASAPLAPAPAPYSASHTTRAPQASKAEAVVSKTIAPTAAGSLSSRYTLHSLLGSGSHGSVYSATDTATGAEVAIKTLHLTHRDEGAPVTALREAVLLKQLKHPHVLPLLDVAMTEQEVCLVFERMDIDLSGYLDAVSRAHPQSSSPLPFVPSSSRSSGLDLYTIKSLTYQLLLAVAYCHRSHVVHRDIKPHNILLSASGLLKLADFGVARSVAVPSKGAVAEVTTLWYRAPELLSPRCALAAPEVPFSASTTGAAYAPSHEGVEGRYSCSISIDMWSVGCVLGELACGVPLFAAGTPLELGKRIEELLGKGAAGVPEGGVPTSTTSAENGSASSEHLSVSPAPLPISPPVGPYTRTRARARIGAAFPSLGAAGADLLSVLLDPDPAQRITAKKALLHPFFDDIRVVSKAACSAAQAVASAVSSAETVTTGHVQSEAQCACECARVQEPACGCERGRGPGPVARVLSSVLTASAAVGARVMVPPDPHNPQPQTQPQIEAQAQAQVQTQRAHTPASLASSVALAAPTVGHRAGSTYTRTTAPAVRTSSSASAEGMAVTGWSALPVPIPSPVLENDAEYCSFDNCQLPSHHHQRQQQQQEREVPEYDQEQWESRYVNVPLQTKPRPSSGYAHPLHHPQGEETPPLIVRTPSSAPSSSALSSPVAVRASATPSTSSAASTARTRPISPAFTAIQAAVPVVFPGRAVTPNVDTTAGNRARTHGAGGGSAHAHGHLDIAWPSPGSSACAVSRGGSVPVSPASALRSLALHHIARSEQPKQQQQQQVLPRSNSLGAFPWLPLPPSALLSLVIAAISLMAAGYLHADGYADGTEKSETPSGHDSSCGEDTWPSTPSGRARVAAAALHSLGRSDPLLHAAAIAAALTLGGPDAMRPYECHAHHTHEHARGQGRACQCAGKAEGATCVWTRPVTVGDTVCDTPTAGVADPGETGSAAGSSSACACACACGRSCRRGASHSPHCHPAHARAHGPSSGRRVAVRYGTSVRLGASFRHVLRAVTRLARVTRADFALLM